MTTLTPALLAAYRLLLPILEREAGATATEEEPTTVFCAGSEPPTEPTAPRWCACTDDLLMTVRELEGEASWNS